jgi:hypothetical protein
VHYQSGMPFASSPRQMSCFFKEPLP